MFKYKQITEKTKKKKQKIFSSLSNDIYVISNSLNLIYLKILQFEIQKSSKTIIFQVNWQKLFTSYINHISKHNIIQ